GPAGRSGWWCSTSPTRSSLTSPGPWRTSPASTASRCCCATATTSRPRRPPTSTCSPSSGCRASSSPPPRRSRPAWTRPTAVVCANDLLALGMLQELVRQGCDVPGDVALVGYDDIEFAAAAAVPLTSVRKPRAELGRLAAAMVLEEASDPGHVHRQLVLEPVLVVRESSTVRSGARRGR